MERISDTILGFDVNSINVSRFILTNIKPLFYIIIAAGSAEKSYSGFYQSVTIQLKGERYMMTLLTPGNVIIDVLKLIAPAATSVSLLGLCGSLRPEHPVTSVVVPQYVTESNEPTQRETLNPDCHTGLCVCQVDGLVQTESFYKHLLQCGIDLVDMESYFMKKHLPNVSLKTISIVSDMPLISPFHKDNPVKIDVEAIISRL